MELFEILEIIYHCSLTEESMVAFLLKLIDHMIIEGSKNPFEDSAEDTLKRIFRGTNPFPKNKAKYIYLHKDESRLSSYLQKMGDNIIYNIEAEIQTQEDSYQHDDSCFNLSKLLFEKTHNIYVKTSKKNCDNTEKAEEDENLYRQAQAFCIEHEEEIELLPLCQIASFLNPLHKYVRQMFTDYCKCSAAVKKKILQINNCKELIFSDKNWISKSLDLYDKKIHEMKLCTVNFLYDGGKYFHRAFQRYSDIFVEYDPWVFDPLIKMEPVPFKKDYKCNFRIWTSNYIELINSNTKEDIISPIDSMWAYCRNANVPEDEVTYWVCMSMIATCSLLNDHIGGITKHDEIDLYDVDLGDSEDLINSQEDMYLYALLELFILFNRLKD